MKKGIEKALEKKKGAFGDTTTRENRIGKSHKEKDAEDRKENKDVKVKKQVYMKGDKMAKALGNCK